MNRETKLKILRNALDGRVGALAEIRCQQRRKEMPFLDVHAIIGTPDCHPLFLDLEVVHGEIDDDHKTYESLRACIQRFANAEPAGKYGPKLDAFATIEIDDDRYDSLPVDHIQIERRDRSKVYFKGKTIADLRQYFYQSAEAVDGLTFVVLRFQADLSSYDWYYRKFNPTTEV